MQAFKSWVDHLVVVARTREEGADYCERMLGVRAQGGGAHALMGTHNRLLHLGGNTYLETIAVNPDAPPPGSKRWFGMDLPEVRERTRNGPWLATFVAATDDIEACVAAVPDLGVVHDLQRDNIRWRMAIRTDGAQPEFGGLPTLIQWPPGVHATNSMPDSGCHLLELEIRHPDPDALLAIHRRIGLGGETRLRVVRSAIAEAGLSAKIATPHGERSL